MRYLPVYCDACARAALLFQTANQSLRCPACGNPCDVIPGPAYSAGDLPLFTEIEAIVKDAALGRVEATVIAAELERVSIRSEPAGLAIERISVRLPALQPLHDSLQDYPHHLNRAVGMLLTVVAARAKGPRSVSPRQSGMHPAVTADLFAMVPQKREKQG